MCWLNTRKFPIHVLKCTAIYKYFFRNKYFVMNRDENKQHFNILMKWSLLHCYYFADIWIKSRDGAVSLSGSVSNQPNQRIKENSVLQTTQTKAGLDYICGRIRSTQWSNQVTDSISDLLQLCPAQSLTLPVVLSCIRASWPPECQPIKRLVINYIIYRYKSCSYQRHCNACFHLCYFWPWNFLVRP